jgi:hypothetical protein
MKKFKRGIDFIPFILAVFTCITLLVPEIASGQGNCKATTYQYNSSGGHQADRYLLMPTVLNSRPIQSTCMQLQHQH